MNIKRFLPFGIALSAALAIWFNVNYNASLFSIFKALTTLLVIVLAALGNWKTKYGKRVLIGLIFCLFGDVFLLNENYFIFGLASFLVAHLFFVFAFISQNGFQFNLSSLLVLLLIGVGYYAFLYPYLSNLAIPVLVYFSIILMMCWQGVNGFILHKNTYTKLILVAVSLFLISDAILAYDKFVEGFFLAKILILATYWGAVGLIANSTTH